MKIATLWPRGDIGLVWWNPPFLNPQSVCGNANEEGSIRKLCARSIFLVQSRSNQGEFGNGSQSVSGISIGAISLLSPAQKQQTQCVLQGETEAVPSLEAIEAKLAETRQCPHRDTPGAVSRGKARGLRRYQCKACKKTFNAATGTALQGIHKKERRLTYGECLADGLTIRESAERCNIAVSTAFY